MPVIASSVLKKSLSEKLHHKKTNIKTYLTLTFWDKTFASETGSDTSHVHDEEGDNKN